MANMKIDKAFEYGQIRLNILNVILIFVLMLLNITSCSEAFLEKNEEIELCDCNKLEPTENYNIWLLNNKPYTGECETFYDNGMKESHSVFKNGKFNGALTIYYKNGQIEEYVEYIDGIQNGDVVYYYENGDTTEYGVVKDDKKTGKWVGFHENGMLMYIHNWQNDLLNDSCFDYFENGSIEMKGFYVNGKANGLITFYDSLTGGIDGYLEYENDSLVRMIKK